MGHGIEPRKIVVVEADAVVIAEGETSMSSTGQAPGTSGMQAPPGSKTVARTQGLSRNLGGLVTSGSAGNVRTNVGSADGATSSRSAA